MAWGSEVTATTQGGKTFTTSREHCKGDPELALTRADMHDKAIELLVFGGLGMSSAESLCESILGLPETDKLPPLFGNFLAYIH